MKTKVSYLIYKIRTGFWFVPTVITIGAIVLSQLILMADRHFPAALFEKLGGLFLIGPEAARLLMSTIAGSMITVTSLVFSLTLIALTMTSSQFGPRLLTSFMQDRVTQIVLGTFLATFVFSLITLGSIHKANEEEIVPHLSIGTAMVMAIGSFGILIYFIHHIASSIQADSIIAKVARELDQAIESQFEAIGDDGDAQRDSITLPERENLAADSATVRSNQDGYIQAIDHERLMVLGVEHNVTVWLECRAGHFIVPGEPIALVHPASRANADVVGAVADTLVVGQTHTMVQDLEFAVNALVEIALRALSPGINDTYTAIACIDNISSALAEVLKRRPPPPALLDDAGSVRVIVNPLTFGGLLASAFNEIRQTAPGNVSVVIRLLEALIRIAPFATEAEQQNAIFRQAQMIDRSFRTEIDEPNDRDDIEQRFKRLADILDKNQSVRSA
ncbi:MAG: DUF2254 domain-containing protein [Alphaproteobacteria bacterium]